jgi:DNA polymerase V|tara:strand:+ start:406 stop:840 length:435 start_codon:yes stop_codon:yes gene_type:complete
MKNKKKLNFFTPNSDNNLDAILINAGISAGFPSPAGDFKQERISLDKELIKNKEATFFARVSGESMINAGLEDGDLIVIDRSIEPANNKIAVCFVEGEFTVKRLIVKKDRIWLKPENSSYKPIEVKDEDRLIIWGIVTNVIKKL